MGILEKYHHKGFGKMLFSTSYEWGSFLQVKTLYKTYLDKHYTNTRKFYKAIGFKELEYIPEIWGETCPCLIMIMEII